MENIQNIGVGMPTANKPAPLTAFEGVSAMSPAQSISSPSRKPFTDISSELNSPDARCPFSADKFTGAPVPNVVDNTMEVKKDHTNTREASEAESKELKALHIVNDLVDGVSPSRAGEQEPFPEVAENVAQHVDVGFRCSSDAESKELKALHIVDDLINGVSPSKAGEESESDAGLKDSDYEDVVEFLSDKLDSAEHRNRELEEYIYLMQIEEGKWGAEQNSMWNSMSAMQTLLSSVLICSHVDAPAPLQ